MRAKKLLVVAAFLFATPVVAQIDMDNLENYANQFVPSYITQDNSPANNPITDAGATLGQVLFHDRALSTNNAVSCNGCHNQVIGFTDFARVSFGVNGPTNRHSMRLINARFATETRYFWDERAASLELQTTMPIREHNELGFSGTQGAGNFDDLIDKLEEIPYYSVLFTHAFGDPTITEERMQRAMAQFIRSIQSFDSKYDEGRAQVSDELTPFPNFTAEENAGKILFNTSFKTTPGMANGIPVAVRTSGGLNCAACHRGPEFAIDPNSGNNGIIDLLLSGNPDPNNTRAPSLRDVLGPDGATNGGMFHTALNDQGIKAIVQHYDLPFDPTQGPNPDLDPRLKPDGNPQFLDITQTESDQLEAFLGTLTGTDVYSNSKWANPFESNGELIVIVSALPDVFSVTQGDLVSGDENNLANSDNSDLSARRSSTDVQSRVEIEIESTSYQETPNAMAFVVEASVFARNEVTQTTELFNYDSSSWEKVDSREATRFSDSTSEIDIQGDLARFVNSGDLRIRARVRFQSLSPRQRFAANVDMMKWRIQ